MSEIVICPADTWTRVAQDVRGGWIEVKNKRPNVYLWETTPKGGPAPTDNATAHRLRSDAPQKLNKINNRDVWVKPLGKDGAVSIDQGNDSQNVKEQPVTSEPIDLELTRFIDTLTLLDALVLDQKTFGIETAGSVPAVGNVICLKEGSFFTQVEIKTVTPIAGNQYTIVTYELMDNAFTADAGCSLRDPELANVNGTTVSTPAIYLLGPENLAPGTKFEITRIIGVIIGSGAMDDTLFGDQSELADGCLLRVKTAEYTKNIFNSRNNGEFRLRSFDLNYSDKAGGGENSASFRRSFLGEDKSNTAIRLDAEDLDEIQMIVQNPLDDLSSFRVSVQGRVSEFRE